MSLFLPSHTPSGRMVYILGVLCTLFFILSVQAAELDQQETRIKLSTGLLYSNGQGTTFDNPNVSTTSLPLLINLKQGRFSLGLSTAYQSLSSDTFSAEGLGDTTLSVGYDLLENPWLTLNIKQKFATGDSKKGLSTGKNDTSLQLDYFYPLQPNTALFAHIGHKFVGKVRGAAMQDTRYASLGTAYTYMNNANIGLSLDYRESIFKRLEDQAGLSVFLSQPLNKIYSYSLFAGYDSTHTLNSGITLSTQF